MTPKYKNKWAVNIIAKWQRLREVEFPFLDCGGLFKEYDLHKITVVFRKNDLHSTRPFIQLPNHATGM